MVSYPGDTLKRGAKDLLTTGLFSDLEIKCGDKSFKVHKAILYPQSTYFKKLLAGNFSEATTNISIHVLPEDPAIMSAVIHYLYHFSWNDSTRGSTPAPIFAIQVYAAANIYDIEQLRALAATRFKESLDPHNTSSLIESIAAVEENIAGEDHVFWDFLMPIVKKNMRALLRNKEFKEMLKENESLNFRLLAELSLGGEDETEEGGVEDENTEQAYHQEQYVSFGYGGGRRLGSG